MMERKLKLTVVVILAIGLLWATGVIAQLTVLNSNVPPGFGMTGYIQAATLDSLTDATSGGTLTMNGITMIVPANSVVQFPANTLSWQSLFDRTQSDPVYDGGIVRHKPSNLKIQCSDTRACVVTRKPDGSIKSNICPCTGLALADNPAQIGQCPTTGACSGAACASCFSPFLPFNAIVQGNIDIKNEKGFGAGKYIVGLIVPINQDLGNGGQGFITFIDYPNGRFEVGGTLGMQGTGTIVEINDPMGRYGWAHSPDQRWSVDWQNPTIATGNGYPMGLPKVPPTSATAIDDPDRPTSNRPLNPAPGTQCATNVPFIPRCHDPFLQTNAPLLSFFMKASPRPGSTGQPPDPTDPWKQVPLMVGDYVTYFGVVYKIDPKAPLDPDPTKWKTQTYVSVNTVSVDKLAAYTQPCPLTTQDCVAQVGPAYVQLGRMVVGTGGPLTPPGVPPVITVPPNQGLGILGGNIPIPEPRNNIMIRGFVTDSSQLVDIVAVDFDPASGSETLRVLTNVMPQPGFFNGGFINGVPVVPILKGDKGRFKFDMGKFGGLGARTRFYAAYSRHGIVQLPDQTPFKTATIVPMANPPVGTDPGIAAPVAAGGLSNGLWAGQYHAPMFTFQFPDAAPGFPSIPNNFGDTTIGPCPANGPSPCSIFPFLNLGEGGNPSGSAGPLKPIPPVTP